LHAKQAVAAPLHPLHDASQDVHTPARLSFPVAQVAHLVIPYSLLQVAQVVAHYAHTPVVPSGVLPFLQVPHLDVAVPSVQAKQSAFVQAVHTPALMYPEVHFVQTVVEEHALQFAPHLTDFLATIEYPALTAVHVSAAALHP